MFVIVLAECAGIYNNTLFSMTCRLKECPNGYGEGFIHDIVPSVRLRGDSMFLFEVAAEVIDGSVRLSTGWQAFVQAERIVAGDEAMFVMVAPHRFDVKLFGANRLRKPMGARPSVWNPEVATNGDGVPLGQPAMMQQEVPPPEDGTALFLRVFCIVHGIECKYFFRQLRSHWFMPGIVLWCYVGYV
jgi:hypothetical protein